MRIFKYLPFETPAHPQAGSEVYGDVEKDTALASRMFLAELLKMFGAVALLYGTLGAGLALRAAAPGEVVRRSAASSLVFGLASGGVLLILGAAVLSVSLRKRAAAIDFGPAASQTMIRSFRLFGFLGVPLALWDVFRVVIPALGPHGRGLVEEWHLWLLMVGVFAGWFAGRAIGGLVGLRAIALAGKAILNKR